MKNNGKKEKWFAIELIPRVNYFMLVPIFRRYGEFIAKQGGGHYFNKVLWIYKKGTTILYYPRNDFDKGVNFIFRKAIANPSWAGKANRDIVFYTQKYLKLSKSLEKKNFKNFSNKQLSKTYWELIEYQRKSHNSGQLTTWLIDAGHQYFSKYLEQLLSEKTSKLKIKVDPVSSFTLLTTPDKASLAEKESATALKIALLIKNNKQARRIFSKNKVSQIISKLGKIEPSIKIKILNHYQKYLWIHYTYEGPVLGLDYFIEIWKGLMGEVNLEKLIKESGKKFAEVKNKRSELFRKLRFSSKEKALFNVAKNIVWLKGWRKDCMYFGSYILDKIALEIGKRLGLSLRQVRMFCDWEVEDALTKNKFDSKESDKRYNYSIIYTKSDGKPLIASGLGARKFLAGLEFEKERINKDIREIKGQVASSGKAKGVVKIIETVEDVKKMKKGDILISETTYPALVPAMKLAAAIVTNVGGLTCHAAIVSRELNIPCVVGTKIATKVLKDGDFVEVDANKGIVKIIKN